MHKYVECLWKGCGLGVGKVGSVFAIVARLVYKNTHLHMFFREFSQNLSTVKHHYFICFVLFFHTFHTTNNNLNFYQRTYL